MCPFVPSVCKYAHPRIHILADIVSTTKILSQAANEESADLPRMKLSVHTFNKERCRVF